MANMTGCQAINEALRLEMQRDPNLLVFGEDVEILGGGMGQCAGLHQQFGDRAFNTPISESGFMEAAVGLALAGVPSVSEVQFADFISLGFDAVVNQAAKLRYLNDGKVSVPLVFRAPQGTGFFFGAQHSQIVESWFSNVPGLKIVVPGSPADMKGMLISAIRDPDPVLFLEHKVCLFVPGEVPGGEYTVPLGKANIVKEGKDLTIISWQKGIHIAGTLIPKFAELGIDVELVDLRSIVPYDKELIAQSVSKTGRAMIVHEAPTRGGFGGELAAFIQETCFKDLKAPVKRIGSANIPIPFGGADAFVMPQSEDIINSAIEIMKV